MLSPIAQSLEYACGKPTLHAHALYPVNMRNTLVPCILTNDKFQIGVVP